MNTFDKQTYSLVYEHSFSQDLKKMSLYEIERIQDLIQEELKSRSLQIRKKANY